MTNTTDSSQTQVDVLLIGAGIMSATLGVLLKELQPESTIAIFERLPAVAAESSDAWNNAGTGHAAYCELNYTAEEPDGSVPNKKAVGISESFEVSKQFWTYLVKQGALKSPSAFIRKTPHVAFVWGEANLQYFRTRYASMKASPLFADMDYSEDPAVLRDWMPLVMNGRDPAEKVAATRMDIGTDVNFGALTRELVEGLTAMPGVTLSTNHEVHSLNQQPDKSWVVTVQNRASGATRTVRAKFVFIGAGGHSLLLLQKSGIPEGRGYGGFPVGGQWLKCTNPEVVEQHQAKVYGKASVGAPPMSVPHLDTRIIDGQKALLFGPYAGFSTKFLKKGSLLDLPLSIKFGNMIPMLFVAKDNLALTWYLITQVLQTPKARFESLKEYYPEARFEDWKLEIAGQRVQVIKKDPKKHGILQFGTEVVCAGDGSIAALLGASPGASTTISIMLTLLGKCFPTEMASEAWKAKLRQMIPSYGKALHDDAWLCQKVRKETGEVLGVG